MSKNKILALDCSLRLTCAALSIDENIICSESLDLGRRQAAELPALVSEKILKKSGVSLDEINYIALANGPGYFTGIRVGAAYAAGLAFGLGIKIIPVSSLEALAHNYLSLDKNLNKENLNKEILVIVYAGHGSVYAASFNPDKDLKYENLKLGQYDFNAIKDFIDKNKNLSVISDDPERALNALNSNLDVSCELVKPNADGLIKAALSKLDFALNPAELRIEYCKGAI